MELSGWGRYPRIQATARTFDDPALLPPILAQGPSIPHGLGRSYGDSSLAERTVLTRRFNCILDFDFLTGELTCEAGLSLAEIMDAFLPRGWFPKVTPGTKFVSVGGAIASDVHGKNHHVAGCFSNCVKSFTLMLPDGDIKTCSRTENPELFRATCGGMGLTGVILTAVIELRRVGSAHICQRIHKAANLAEAFTLFEENAHYPYSVAWIDCLAKGDRQGRSLLMLGDHADCGGFRYSKGLNPTVPFNFPGFALNSWSVKAFNWLYFHKVRKTVTDNNTSLDSFFYPLDSIHNWNRIYGRKGFLQWQCVLPKETSFRGLSAILTKIADAGLGSFLAVLKLFGPENDNPLSFPMEGYTLALDFPYRKKLFALLDDLDKTVLEYGGRLYLTKDARMSKETLLEGYPRLDEFLEIRGRHDLAKTFSSLQSQRLEL